MSSRAGGRRCARCQRERECDLKLKRVLVLVKLLQQARGPAVLLPTGYPTTTGEDVCFGVGMGMLGLRVQDGDLYVALTKRTLRGPVPRGSLRRLYACRLHRARGGPGRR